MARRLRHTMATGAACVLIGAGIMAIRSWATLRGWLEPYPFFLRLFFGSSPEGRFPGGFPPTFGAALALLAMGVLLLTSATPGRQSRDESRPLGWSLTPTDWIVLALPLPVLGLFGFAQWKGLHNHWALALAFLAILLLSVGFLSARERGSGIRLGFSISMTEFVGLAIGSLAVLAFYAKELNSWKFSFIGDEWAFFTMGNLPSRSLWKIPWLEADGVYGQIPVFVSGWQLLFMNALGNTNFAWRISMAIMIAVCAVPLYLIARHLLRHSPKPHLAAAVGCAWFATSEFIMDWARIGKPLAVLVPPLVFGFCLFLAARERHSKSLFLLAGIVAGLGTMLNPLSALLPMGVFAGLLCVEATAARSRDELRSVFVAGIFVLAGFLLASAPILVEVGYWREQVVRNFSSAEAEYNRHLLLPRTAQSFFTFLDYRASNHFLWKNVVDPVTSFFVVAGFGMGRFLGWRRFLYLVVTLLMTGFLAGGISQYAYPSPTRLLVIMVPLSLLAAAGFAGLTHRAPRVAPVLALGLVSFAAAYNVLKLEGWNPYGHPVEFPQNEVRRFEESSPETIHALFLPEQKRGLLKVILQAYGYAGRVEFLDNTKEGRGQLGALLQRRTGQTEVRSWEFGDNSEIRALTEKAGARFAPIREYEVPKRPAGSSELLRRVFEVTNP